MELIKYNNVSIEYVKDKPVISDASFEIEKGTITSLLGLNGCGKTTLMSTMNRLMKIKSGSIEINGEDIYSKSYKEVSKLIAFVPQYTMTSFNYSVRETVMLGRAPHISYLPGKRDYEIVDETLRYFGIEHLKNKKFNSISGGERQMASLARAIVQQAPIVLMDEPTTYLDLRNQNRILNVIKDINQKQGVTFLLTLHDPNHAGYISHNIMMIKNGKVNIGKNSEMITEEKLKALYEVDCKIHNNNNGKHIEIVLQ